MVAATVVCVASGYTQHKHQNIWLINMITPHTLGKGQLQLDISGRYTNYEFPDPRSKVIDFFFVTSYGLTRRLGVSLTAPFSWRTNQIANWNGMTDMALLIKYNILETGRFNIAIGQNILFPTGRKEDLLGAGKINLQLNIASGFQLGRTGLLANVEFGEIGYLQPIIQINPSGSLGDTTGMIRHAQAWTFSSGLTFGLDPLTFVVETVGRVVPKFSDKDLFMQVGAILRVGNVILRGSGGVGLAGDGGANTKTRGTVGLSYVVE